MGKIYGGGGMYMTGDICIGRSDKPGNVYHLRLSNYYVGQDSNAVVAPPCNYYLQSIVRAENTFYGDKEG